MQIRSAVKQFSQVTQQNQALSEEMPASSEELTGQAEQLKEIISFFNIGDKSAKFTCTNPYPDDFDKGLITAMARKFKPVTSAIVNVTSDTNQPARSKGADSTIFLVNW